jgi:hypothetical protein
LLEQILTNLHWSPCFGSVLTQLHYKLDYLLPYNSGLIDKDGTIQVNTLIYCMGSEADEIFSSFQLTDYNKKKVNVVKEKLDRYHFLLEQILRNLHWPPCFGSVLTQLHYKLDYLLPYNTDIYYDTNKC